MLLNTNSMKYLKIKSETQFFLNKMSLARVVAVSNILEIQCNTIAMTSLKGTFEHPYFPQRSQLIL